MEMGEIPRSRRRVGGCRGRLPISTGCVESLRDRNGGETIPDQGNKGVDDRLGSEDAATRVLLTRALVNKDIRATRNIFQYRHQPTGLRPAMEPQRIRTCRYQIRRVLNRVQ